MGSEQTTPDSTDAPAEAGNRDVIDIEVTERAGVHVESDLLCCDIDSVTSPGLRVGVTVLQHGDEIALRGGTVGETETPKLTTWNGLTPTQARRLADALQTAADQAETSEPAPPESDDQSLIARLLG